uniref:Uncharacterized protein n=1 Tax=Heterorhabditis bacteriophora TaxID=37862 RepID=A0A1I7WUJ0_HETBA
MIYAEFRLQMRIQRRTALIADQQPETLSGIFFHRSSIRSSIGPRSYGMALWCRAYGLGVEAQDRVRSVSRTNRNNSHHNSCLCLTTFTIAPKSFTGQKKVTKFPRISQETFALLSSGLLPQRSP